MDIFNLIALEQLNAPKVALALGSEKVGDPLLKTNTLMQVGLVVVNMTTPLCSLKGGIIFKIRPHRDRIFYRLQNTL